ncbi:MAG: J domain-containing protein [Sphingomonas bacterium]|nr:J domain-containing protein [Sphingomonas bacterium]
MASRQEKWKGRIEGAAERCAARGCPAPGEFRAPLTPGDFDGPGSWHYLCLEHVRTHNARYNYFAGMSPDEIEAAQSPIAGWERSSRAFAGAGTGPGPPWSEFIDPLDAISARFRPGMARPTTDRFSAAERHALDVMGLGDEVDRTALRRRYSELVRRFHPDRNGGDRGYEGKLAAVIEAYQTLKGARAFAA